MLRRSPEAPAAHNAVMDSDVTGSCAPSLTWWWRYGQVGQPESMLTYSFGNPIQARVLASLRELVARVDVIAVGTVMSVLVP